MVSGQWSDEDKQKRVGQLDSGTVGQWDRLKRIKGEG